MNFSPANHEYTDNKGRIVLSVTQTLRAAGLIDDRWYNEESREMGSAVHELCQWYASGCRKDRTNRPLDGLMYVNSFARWMRERQVYAISAETVLDIVIDGQHRGGKYDLLAEIDHRRVLIDIKTGTKAKWHIVQLAAYALGINPDCAMDLYLKSDGTYTERWLTPFELLSGVRQFRDAVKKTS